MKKYLFSIFAIALLFIVPTKVMAATTIGQTDFNDALGNPGTAYNGVTYDDTEGFYILAEGDYTLGTDIDLTNASIILSSNVKINLNGKEILSSNDDATILVRDAAAVTIDGEGTIISTSVDGVALKVQDEATLTFENGATDGGFLASDSTTITINGGKIDEYASTTTAKTTVNGGEIGLIGAFGASNITINNGTINGLQTEGYNAENLVTVVINNATFTRQIIAMFANITIIDGTFTGSMGSEALYIVDGSSAVIKGGTFTGGENSGVLAEVWDGTNVKSVKISGGTFKGPISGLALSNVDDVELTGGKFIATDAEHAQGGIVYIDTNDTTILARILGEGYVYNPTLISQTKLIENEYDPEYNYNIVYSQTEIEVIPVVTEATPSTLDNIGTYVTLAIIAATSLVGTIVVTKKTLKAN